MMYSARWLTLQEQSPKYSQNVSYKKAGTLWLFLLSSRSQTNRKNLWRYQKVWQNSLTMPKYSNTERSELSNNNKSFENYGTQTRYPLDAPEIAL